jgi:hypothetical protein
MATALFTPSGPAIQISGSTIAGVDPVTGTVHNGAESIFFVSPMDTADPVDDATEVTGFVYTVTVTFTSVGGLPVNPLVVMAVSSTDDTIISGSYTVTPDHVAPGGSVTMVAAANIVTTIGDLRTILKFGCAIGQVIQAGAFYTQDVVFSAISLVVDLVESGGGSLTPGEGLGGGGTLVTFTHA